jgi:hypothetical protein
VRLGSAEQGETGGAFAFDERSECLPQQRALLARPGQSLGLNDQVVV